MTEVFRSPRKSSGVETGVFVWVYSEVRGGPPPQDRRNTQSPTGDTRCLSNLRPLFCHKNYILLLFGPYQNLLFMFSTFLYTTDSCPGLNFVLHPYPGPVLDHLTLSSGRNPPVCSHSVHSPGTRRVTPFHGLWSLISSPSVLVRSFVGSWVPPVGNR